MTDGSGTAVLVDSNGQLGTISSSRRYKEDIQDMSDASSGLLKPRAGHVPLPKVLRGRLQTR